MGEVKFKVGDRVAVYGRSWGDSGVIGGDGSGSPRTVCEVRAVGLDYNLIRVGVDEGHRGWSALVHPKQCRRLVKKPRRRVWALVSPSGAIQHTVFDEDEAMRMQAMGSLIAVEFVEVKRRRP